MGVRHVFRHMPFTPEQLHQLAWDVEDYPVFINFISALRVISSNDTKMRAEVRIKYKMLRESFITDVLRNEKTLEISVVLVKGPFRKLENHWRFHQLSDGSTLVEFWVDFTFSLPLMANFFAAKQIRAEQSILEAFERRAKQLFASPTIDSNLDETVQKEIFELQTIHKHG
ncbi:MAG: type II toxin-antitoxin system RatA family toxin [Robiginitomaculum sp.]|nr:type II toxin-antitoxin system RatA family toxin [Robiginitomaculum sp.]